MKLRFIFFSLLFSVILLSCGWQIPEKISVKSNASYNFTTGEIDTKLNDSLNFDELIKPNEDSEFTVYNYLPDGKSRQFVMRMAVADIPIDLESSFNESSINEAIKDLSFTQEIKVPSISFSSQTEIPLSGFPGGSVDKATDFKLNALEFSFTNDTESDIFESCEVKQGKLFTEIIIPSDWNGVSVSYSFSANGGLVVEESEGETSGTIKTIELAGKTITKEQVNATAQITLTVQSGYSVSSSPLMLNISSDIESLETLNVKLSDVTTSFNKKEDLPEGMKDAFSKIYLNSSGVKIDYVNTLPAENDIKLTVNSDFFGLSDKTGDLEANTQGVLELLSDSNPQEIDISASPSYDFDVKISLPGATSEAPQKVSLQNVKFGDTYQISMNITPVLNLEKIVLKEGFAKNDKKELPFNIKELLSSVSDKISDENLFANIEIKSLPIYVFFTKPQTNGSNLFTNSNFTGKMSVYYGTDSKPKQENGVDISQTLVDKDSEDENIIPREIGFVDYPELNISEDNKKVLSSLDNVSFSLKGDVAKIINSAMKDTSETDNSLYVDYNLEFTNGSNGELEISKNDLATKGSIGVYIYIVLPFEFRVSEEVNVSAQKLLNDTIDGDIFGRKSKDDFVNVEDYFALINSASVYYEFTKLPVCSDNSDSIAFDIGMDCGEGGANIISITEDSSIRKGTITISKKNVEDMLKEYPVKPTMNLSIKENSEFYIPQIFDVAVKLNLNIQTDGEIEIFGGQ